MINHYFNDSESEEAPVLIDLPAKRTEQHQQISPTDYARPALQKLVQSLKSPDMRVRCKAARDLREASDPATAQALVEALEDNEIEVRWLASEALASLGAAAVIPLLEALTTRFESNHTRDGARHILHAMQQRGELSAPLIPVYRSLGGVASVMQTPWAAKEALETLGAYPSSKKPAGFQPRKVNSIFAHH
jgi:hypothetical protein